MLSSNSPTPSSCVMHSFRMDLTVCTNDLPALLASMQARSARGATLLSMQQVTEQMDGWVGGGDAWIDGWVDDGWLDRWLGWVEE